jgi:hypothetical protein
LLPAASVRGLRLRCHVADQADEDGEAADRVIAVAQGGDLAAHVEVLALHLDHLAVPRAQARPSTGLYSKRRLPGTTAFAASVRYWITWRTNSATKRYGRN